MQNQEKENKMVHSRSIKFRAWDKIGKGMLFNVPINKEGRCAISTEDRFELMQYTGLKDKNGKEIYEGDILLSNETSEVYKVDDMFPVHRHTHITNIGFYMDKKYNLRDNPAGQYDNQDDWMSWPEMYEVIGNIYQNPDLLTK